MAAGKAIATLEHPAALAAVHFSPIDFVLATACQDSVVRFWDLETFSVLDSCGPEANAATACCFLPDGSSLLAAHEDGLRAYSFEPAGVTTYASAPLGCAADMAVWDDSAVAACLQGAVVSVWSLPGADDARPSAGAPSSDPQAPSLSPSVHSGAGARVSTGCAAPPVAPAAAPPPETCANNCAAPAHVPGVGVVERGAGHAVSAAGEDGTSRSSAPAERQLDGAGVSNEAGHLQVRFLTCELP